jgi:hypothetical protein
MAHGKGLSAKAVEDILLNSGFEEEFGSDSDSESQSDSEVEDKLPKGSGDATTAQKKQKVEGWP